MHAAPMPPGHMLRAALLALLLTVAMLLAITELAALDLGLFGSGGEAQAPAPAAEPAAASGDAAWLRDPLASPALDLAR